MVRKRRSRRSQKNALGFIIITVVAIIIITFIVSFLKANSSLEAYDPNTLCPLTGITGKTVILIDRTDPLNEIQRQEIKVYLNDIKNSIALHSAIIIYGIDKPEPSWIKPDLFLCNPGKGEKKSKWTSNPMLAKKTWDIKFSKRVDETIDKLMEPLKIRNSPIMEAIKVVTIGEFVGNKNSGIAKKLIIISDMIQNTSTFSQYKNHCDFTTFKSSRAFGHYLTDMRGIDVEIFYVRRPNLRNVQGKKHILFWQQYFNEMGAILTKVISVI